MTTPGVERIRKLDEAAISEAIATGEPHERAAAMLLARLAPAFDAAVQDIVRTHAVSLADLADGAAVTCANLVSKMSGVVAVNSGVARQRVTLHILQRLAQACGQIERKIESGESEGSLTRLNAKGEFEDVDPLADLLAKGKRP
ncbi:MAG: hypothetical protein AB7S41_11300 [Parvibaculaceae bacterium]